MNRLRDFWRFRLRTLFILVAVAGALAWWFGTRPREYARRQTLAGRQLIHDRDRTYLASVFDQTVRDHLVTVIGDSRLTHWNSVIWIACPDDQTIVSYGLDHALLVWNCDDGSIRRGFYDVMASAYAPTAKTCFMVTTEGKLRTWSLDKDLTEEERTVPANFNYAGLACSPCGRFLAYHMQVVNSGKWTVWDREAGREVLSVDGRYEEITFSPDSKTVLFIGHATINEYDTIAGKLLSQMTVPPEGKDSWTTVYAAAFSATGEYLFVGDVTGRLFVYAWAEKQIVREMKGSPSTIRSMDVWTREKGADIAMANNNNCVKEDFNVNPAVRTWTTILLNEVTTAVCYGPNGTVAGIRDGRLVVMDGGAPRRMVGGPRVDATCFAFSPRGDRIALAGRDGQIVIRETSKWERVQSWRAHDGWVRRLVWSPRGDLLLSKADDNVLAAWDPRTGDELHSFTQFSSSLFNAISFDGSGKYFAGFCGGPNFAIDIVEADTFEAVKTITHKSLGVRGNIILSRDASRLFAGAHKVSINVWSIGDDKLITSLGSVTRDDVKLALNDQEDVIFAYDGRSVSAYDLVNGKLLWTTPTRKCLMSDLSLHPSRPLLATAGNDGIVTLVDTATGTVLRQLRLGPTRGDILQVDFSPDGQLLAVAMKNGAVVILRLPWD